MLLPVIRTVAGFLLPIFCGIDELQQCRYPDWQFAILSNEDILQDFGKSFFIMSSGKEGCK